MATQSKVQHTPGPWTYEADGLIGWFNVSSKHVPNIAECIDNEANAHLIAAAPELLEALVMIHRVMIQRNMTDDEREVADKAWEALRRARGEGV